MRAGLLIVGTVVLMIASGAVAALTTLQALMSLGMKYHDNYEFYGQSPAVILIPIIGIAGFAAPGIIVWRLHKNQWRVSLRTLFMIMTLVAALLGTIVFLMRMSEI